MGGGTPAEATLCLWAWVNSTFNVQCSTFNVRPFSVVAFMALAYKIAVLVFLENTSGEHLLMLRAKPPNLGVWSPIGGKLETDIGESPFECAVRETFEETGHKVDARDFHLFAIIAEKAYEGQAHWLMFLFRCKQPLTALPPEIVEGKFAFFSREAINTIPLPETDRTALWPIYDRYRDRFVSLKADCMPGKPVQVEIEEIV
jgi:8-oxo-dGTP diphosphatase